MDPTPVSTASISTQTDALAPSASVSTAPASTSTAPASTSTSTSSSILSAYKYYQPRLTIQSYKYQDVNNDSNLQQKETFYFLDKTIDWIKNDKSFKKLKVFKRHLNGPDGYNIMYKLLKLFVRRGDTNWYDLKIQQSLVKDYIKHKLTKLL